MTHHALRLALTLVLVCGMAATVLCFPPDSPADTTPDACETDLAATAMVLTDPDGVMDIVRVAALPPEAFSPVGGTTVTFDPGTAAAWIKIPLDGTLRRSVGTTYLSLGWPRLWDADAIVELTLFHRTAMPSSGDGDPAGWRSLRLVKDGRLGPEYAFATPFSFALDFPPGQWPAALFLRVQGDGLRFPLVLRSHESMTAHQQSSMVFFGIYYGIVFTLVILNLSMLVTLRESGYLWLTAYSLAELGFFVSANGFLLDILGSRSLAVSWAWGSGMLGLVGLTTAMLARAFLKTRERSRRFDATLLAHGSLCAVCGLGAMFFSSHSVADLEAALVTLGPFLALGATYACRRRGGKAMVFFSLAWVVWAVGGAVGLASYLGLLPASAVAFHAFQATSALAALLLTIAMAERVYMLRREREVAEAGSQAKSRFLARTSHELRTPLNAILGLADYLLGSRPTPDVREGLGTIRDSGRHLLAVINDILDISSIEAEKFTLDEGDFDLTRLIATTGAIFETNARQKGLAFGVDIDPATPRVVRGDSRRLRQVLINLLGNAVKFTPSGEVRLAVAPDPSAGPDMVAFAIHDTGIGISPEKRGRIFTEYGQADADIGRRFGGTGLGLCIAAHLAHCMGGGIRADSRPGQGSVFTLTAHLPPGEEAAIPPDPAPDDESPVFSEKTLRVLVVDDDPLNCKVSLLHLTRLGAFARAVSSGEKALALLSREPFDVVLLDVEMPGTSGPELARTIRQGGRPGCPRDIPLVAMTAHSRPDAERISREAGMDGFVLKPVNFYELAGFLRRFAREDAPGADNRGTVQDGVLLHEAARRRLGLSRDDYDIVLPICLRELQASATRLRECMTAGDAPAAFRCVHNIKSTAATIGAMACSRAAARLETALRSQTPLAELAGMAAELEHALAGLADGPSPIAATAPEA
ncbi:response regulator [Desulfovibrio sulfodismutans]|uniref:histidine kinase n=1 Tax=Desulfolutivibrio sulfodismutans TaxID=63561 RepID=A0A7K3NKJ2_9BACT|nr:7TM diverse intracellular signaling domain-containing protein [Desulfolutivibrio sulfodismutans]NDY56700.1 response regulator [Desulfolutivibrio sulfodismutans]QLA13495.1 response regulator [Desulfolutivibrio sulfodismutans DSM 3696]